MRSLGTTQVCLFRDNYDTIRTAGFSVFGLSTDSPKANTTFATKQKLPYQLLVSPLLVNSHNDIARPWCIVVVGLFESLYADTQFLPLSAIRVPL